MSEEGFDEANEYLEKFFVENEGSFFRCTEKEAKKAILHRFVIASATPRYFAMNEKQLGGLMSLDIALPRNEKDWLENLPPEMDKLFEMKLYYGHLFCHVMHHNYVVKKGVDVEELQKKLLKTYDDKGIPCKTIIFYQRMISVAGKCLKIYSNKITAYLRNRQMKDIIF